MELRFFKLWDSFVQIQRLQRNFYMSAHRRVTDARVLLLQDECSQAALLALGSSNLQFDLRHALRVHLERRKQLVLLTCRRLLDLDLVLFADLVLNAKQVN